MRLGESTRKNAKGLPPGICGAFHFGGGEVSIRKLFADDDSAESLAPTLESSMISADAAPATAPLRRDLASGRSSLMRMFVNLAWPRAHLTPKYAQKSLAPFATGNSSSYEPRRRVPKPMFTFFGWTLRPPASTYSTSTTVPAQL